METESNTQDYNGCPETCIKKKYYIFHQYDKGVGTILQGSTVAKTFPIS